MRQKKSDQSTPSLLGDQNHQAIVLHQPDEATFRAQANKAQPFKMTGLLDHFPLYRGLKAHATPHQQCDFLASLAPKENIHYSIIPPKKQSYFGHCDDGSLNFSFCDNQTDLLSFCNLLKDYIKDPCLGSLYFQASPIKGISTHMSRLAVLDLSLIHISEPTRPY